MSIQRNYRIHDLLTFQMNHHTSVMERFMDTTEMQFSTFQTSDALGEPDFILDVGPFKPSTRPVKILDNNYRVSEDYLFLKDKRKICSLVTRS